MNTSTQILSPAVSIFFWSIVFTACVLYIYPRMARADSVQIQNVIQTRTLTGDNVVSDGKTVTTGDSSNSVSVHTTVNGENVEDYYASSSDPIDYRSSYTTENGGGVVQVNTSDAYLQKALEDLRQLHESQTRQEKIHAEIERQAKNVRKNKNSGAQAAQVALAAQSNSGNSGSTSSSSTSEKNIDAMVSRISLHGFKTLLSNIFAYVRIWISR